MRFLIYFPPSFSFGGSEKMSGSFMPFCIIVLLGVSLVLGTKRDLDIKTIFFLKVVQAIALSGAVLEPLMEFFDSVPQALASALFIGVLLIFTTGGTTATVFYGGDGGALWPLLLKKARDSFSPTDDDSEKKT
jgi:hypothetical protein